MGLLKDGVEAAKTVMEMIKDDPQAKEAARNLGESAVIITAAIRNCLLPIAIANSGVQKARDYFDHRFGNDMAKKLAAIPEESIVEPRASIVAPAIQALAFSHDEPDLREMYLNLLATSMDGTRPGAAHPAFVDVIRQLSSEDARFFQLVAPIASPMPIARMMFGYPGSQVILRSNLIHPGYLDPSSEVVEVSESEAIIDSWLRLGLYEASYATKLADHQHYAWTARHPAVLVARSSLEKPPPEFRKVTLEHGMLRRTAFGHRFALAIGITPA